MAAEGTKVGLLAQINTSRKEGVFQKQGGSARLVFLAQTSEVHRQGAGQLWPCAAPDHG